MIRLRRPQVLGNLFLLLTGLIVTAFLSEVVVRVFHLEEPRFLQRDSIYGSAKIPGQSGYMQSENGPVYITINSHGFRGPERSYEKPHNIYRIVIIGDSYIEAFSTPYNQTIAQVLEKNLRKEGFLVEVINLGTSNFGTAQELLLLEKEGLRYHPDLVVLTFVHNDVANNHPKLHGDTDRPYFSLEPDGNLNQLPYNPKHRSRGAIRDFFRQKVRIYTFFPKRIRELKNRIRHKTSAGRKETIYRAYLHYVTPLDSIWGDAWVLTRALLREFRRKTEKANAAFILMEISDPPMVYAEDWEKMLASYPELHSAGTRLDIIQPHKLLKAFAEEERITFLSLLPAFQRAAQQGVKLFGVVDRHWNAEGNRVGAEALMSVVRPLIKRD